MTLESIVWIVIIGAVFFFMMKRGGGCCGGMHHGRNEGHDKQGRTDGGNDTGRMHDNGMKIERTKHIPEKDPVCGVRIHDHSICGKHLGRTFHFCSEQCRKIFALNPNKYIRT